MDYSIYHKRTGHIERVVSCDISQLSAQFDGDTHAYMQGRLDDSTVYIADGIQVTLPERPGQHWEFNWETKQWEDPRTLDDLKAAQWTQIKAARETAINAPLETPYGTVDSGPDDRGNITDAVMLLQTMESLGTPITIEFTMFDNTPITLTTAQMVHIGLLLGQKVQAAYVRSQACRAAINAATTKEEVEAVVW